MAIKKATFATILLTVSGFAEHAACSLADVTHVRRFELALHSSRTQWYRDGMQLFAYLFNGHVWERKRHLTWAMVQESDKVPTDRVVAAATNAFGKWSEKTPFRFARVEPDRPRRPDIRISLGAFDEPKTLCNTVFPEEQRVLDSTGVTIVINEDIPWTSLPDDPNWHSLDFALLYEVTHCLGLRPTTVEGSVMNQEHRQFKIDSEHELTDDDVLGIRELYGFNRRPQVNGHAHGVVAEPPMHLPPQ